VLDAYGADYRFETAIFKAGTVSAGGELDGDLILVASGDLTMGGRDTDDGEIAYTSIDHINAGAFPELATLTLQDPLAGLDKLAAQVAEAGISSVSGEVIIDDRLFAAMPKDTYILSPIWINDNLLDLSLTAGAVGEVATLEWRPMSAAYQVEANVQTVAAGEALDVSVSTPAPGKIVVEGQVPADLASWVQIFQVEDPSAHARTLLIEALERAGVAVTATPTGDNPVDLLPAQGSYAAEDQVALHVSLPFSENLKLIQKTSHNQHADMLVFLLALHSGSTSYDDGMVAIRSILEEANIDSTLVSLSDGRGNEYTDVFSPRTVTELLAYMATRPDFPTFFDALPVLGVNGTEATTVPADSPVAGKAFAKSGMTVAGDGMNDRALVMTRALAGYMTGQSGRELVFGIYLNNVPLASLGDVLTVITEHGAIAEAIYERV
jgi:D-alanyl-D-alanine carboxypeptidase/D-alanyl-D-alanine-endopeptidase (penicillin-binding protein 4)